MLCYDYVPNERFSRVDDIVYSAGDSLTEHAGMAFTTKDRDNDRIGVNCAQKYTGAWWYNVCYHSNLNGLYLGGAQTDHSAGGKGISWYHWHGYQYSLKKVEMKLRP